MTSVDSNFNFLCGRPHGARPPSPVHMRPPEPDPLLLPPCGRHKWMAPKWMCRFYVQAYSVILYCINKLHIYLYYAQRKREHYVIGIWHPYLQPWLNYGTKQIIQLLGIAHISQQFETYV